MSKWIVGLMVLFCVGPSFASVKSVMKALMVGYDMMESPTAGTANATLVNVSMHIAHIYDLNAEKEELSVGMYLRAMWSDPRLMYNDSLSTLTYLNIYNWRFKYNIWKPDLFFTDSKSAVIPREPMPASMMRVYKDGRVFVSYRIISNIYCAMDWRNFPMDTQRCPVKLELYSYYKREVKISWHYNHTMRASLRTWPINDFWFKESKQWQDEAAYSAGTYQGMTIDLYFIRNFSYYLRQVFLPSLILALLAYLPCWMKEEAVFSRLMFLFALLACMLVLHVTVTISHPIPVGVYVTALEVWLASCTAFVTMCLMQTVVMRGLSNEAMKTSKMDTIPLAEAGPEASCDGSNYTIVLPAPRLLGLIMTPDMIWRLTYPVLIVLFNIIYWPIYSA